MLIRLKLRKKESLSLFLKKVKNSALGNCPPISLLPFCGKILKELIFDKMFQFFIENKLIARNLFGFKLGYSFNNQVPSITHDIHKSLNKAYELRGVFCSILKVLGKVWQSGIVFKLK